MKNNVFAQNPNLKSYHETADGFKFFRPQDAQVHARGLKNKKVTEVFKSDLKAVETPEVPVAPKAPEAPKTPEAPKAPVTPKEVVPVDPPKAPEVLTPMALAKLRIEAIEKLDTVEAVEAALKDETAKSVKKAAAAHIEALNAASQKES